MQSQVNAVDENGHIIPDAEDEQDDETFDEDDQIGVDGNPKEPKSRDGREWYAWLQSCSSYPHPPDYLVREANESFSRLEQPREGTIGRYLKESAEKALSIGKR